jgi:hypothetical protein
VSTAVRTLCAAFACQEHSSGSFAECRLARLGALGGVYGVDDLDVCSSSRGSAWRQKVAVRRPLGWHALTGGKAAELLPAVTEDWRPMGEQEMVEVDLGGESREAVA